MDANAPKYPLDDITAADLLKRFTGHAITEDAQPRVALITSAHHALAKLVCECIPMGRERSLALTKLEESLFWAMIAIVHES